MRAYVLFTHFCYLLILSSDLLGGCQKPYLCLPHPKFLLAASPCSPQRLVIQKSVRKLLFLRRYSCNKSRNTKRIAYILYVKDTHAPRGTQRLFCMRPDIIHMYTCQHFRQLRRMMQILLCQNGDGKLLSRCHMSFFFTHELEH